MFRCQSRSQPGTKCGKGCDHKAGADECTKDNCLCPSAGRLCAGMMPIDCDFSSAVVYDCSGGPGSKIRLFRRFVCLDLLALVTLKEPTVADLLATAKERTLSVLISSWTNVAFRRTLSTSALPAVSPFWSRIAVLTRSARQRRAVRC